MIEPTEFRRRLLKWFDRHGRTSLPWQSHRTPYRVWVSEIMLQQTRVSTTIPFYRRFIRRFPSIRSLAEASMDDVLHHWTGLGYYARARNLQKAAQQVMSKHGGRFPRTLEQASALPGIGRSTAGAILSLSRGQRHPILDGNVKRVLARVHAVDGPANSSATMKTLWDLAEQYTPRTRVADYTQAIMDLGATVCTPRNPLCGDCPVSRGCLARQNGEPERYPGKAAKKSLPERSTTMLMVRDRDRTAVLMEKRPPSGIWGGLWSFPEHRTSDPDDLRRWFRREYGFAIELDGDAPPIRHTFSHFHLTITPVTAHAVGTSGGVMEKGDTLWYNLDRTEKRGLAAPVKRLLDQLRTDS